jgi:hypothetical protein
VWTGGTLRGRNARISYTKARGRCPARIRDTVAAALTSSGPPAPGRSGHAADGRVARLRLQRARLGVGGGNPAGLSAMNRVASAVGEGMNVVRFVHEYLALT